MKIKLMWTNVALIASLILAVSFLPLLISNPKLSPIVTSEAQQEGIRMIMETIIIFDNGTKVKIGPIEVPCRVVEVTDRGDVVVPEYLPPEANMVTKTPSDSDTTIAGRITWSGLGSGWHYLQAPFNYTFSATPVVAIGCFYSWSDSGHIEDKNNPDSGLGIYTTYFWYRAQSSGAGRAGVNFYATD